MPNTMMHAVSDAITTAEIRDVLAESWDETAVAIAPRGGRTQRPVVRRTVTRPWYPERYELPAISDKVTGGDLRSADLWLLIQQLSLPEIAPDIESRVWRTPRKSGRTHQAAPMSALEERTSELARQSAGDLLIALSSEFGLTWADLSRLIGVSVPAIRKWRLEGGVSPQNHRAMAHLAAMLEQLRNNGVTDPSRWLSLELVRGYTVTPRDLFSLGHASIVVQIATGATQAVDFLDSELPDWRSTYWTEFEVRVDADGEPSVFSKGS